MNKIILFISVFLMINTVYAQSERLSREKIDAYKKLYLTDRLKLEPSLETAFWNSYKTYEDSLTKLYKDRRLKYRKMNINDMSASDEEYAKYINDFMNYEKKKVDLKVILISELEEVMSIKKTYMLFKYEDDFRREMMEKLRKERGEKRKENKNKILKL